jgi:hypothetical protein
MRKHGPTDGVVPIGDSLWPTGVNVVALGSDHLLGDFRNSTHGLALLRTTAFAVKQHHCARSPERSASASFCVAGEAAVAQR